jgi:hypothetical protein
MGHHFTADEFHLLTGLGNRLKLGQQLLARHTRRHRRPGR